MAAPGALCIKNHRPAWILSRNGRIPATNLLSSGRANYTMPLPLLQALAALQTAAVPEAADQCVRLLGIITAPLSDDNGALLQTAHMIADLTRRVLLSETMMEGAASLRLICVSWFRRPAGCALQVRALSADSPLSSTTLGFA